MTRPYILSDESRDYFNRFLKASYKDLYSLLRRRKHVGVPNDKAKHLKLNIGCGNNCKDGWLNVDRRPPADLTIDVTQGLPLPDESCALIYSEHFLEHLEYPYESIPFLIECYRVLEHEGSFHVGVPDARYVVESCMEDPIDSGFLSKIKEHGWGYPDSCHTGFEYINYHFRMGGEHMFAYDAETLKSHLMRSGFRSVEQREFEEELDTRERAEGTLYFKATKE